MNAATGRVAALPRRGVSLIEAMIALGVMAFGMLAVVGVQATLRSNADVSKQRAEATRLAQQGMERLRGFVQVTANPVTALLEYDEIATATEAEVVGMNASYTPSRTVAAAVYPNLKTVTTSVSWLDRAGATQRVELNTAIARIQPELAASLSLPQQSGFLLQVLGRNARLPLGAKNLAGTGTSVFVPPQSPGGTVAWVFNNLTGLITGVCTVTAGATTASLLATDVAGCSNNTTAQLVSGFVRFANTTVQPTPAEAELPSGTTLNLDIVLSLTSTGHPAPGAVCFDDSSSDAGVASGRQTVVYFCAVTSSPSYTWAGRTRIAPRAFNAGVPWGIAAGVGNYTVCRYTPFPEHVLSKNSDHPLDYTANGSPPKSSLTNQNFLVISAAHSCPTETPAPGDFVNANTLVHQNGSATYSNPP